MKRKNNKNKNNTSYASKKQTQNNKKEIYPDFFTTRIKQVINQYSTDLDQGKDDKAKIIQALLASNHPELLEAGGLDLNTLTEEEVISTASLVLQNEAKKSIEYLIGSYKELLSRNELFMNSVAYYVKDKTIADTIIKNIDFAREDGQNLLHIATYLKNDKLIEVLSDSDSCKGMIDSKDKQGLSPLDYAAYFLLYNINKALGILTDDKQILNTLKNIRGNNNAPGYIKANLSLVDGFIKKTNLLSKKKDVNTVILDRFKSLHSKLNDPNRLHKDYKCAQWSDSNNKALTILGNYLYEIDKTANSQKWGDKQQNIKKIIKSIITDDKLVHDINFLHKSLNLFLLVEEELTIKKFIECSEGNLTGEVKLFILGKLAWYNHRHKEINLAFNQVSEAIELAQDLNIINRAKTYEWYDEVMHQIYITYPFITPDINKDFSKTLSFLERAEQSSLTKGNIRWSIYKLSLYINANDFDGAKLLVDTIKDIPTRDLLQSLVKGMLSPKDFFEKQIDELLGKITDIEAKKICENFINILRKDNKEHIEDDDGALDASISRNDIVSMARICVKSKDYKIAERAKKAMEDNYKSLQKEFRHELYQISKALIYLSSGDYDLASKSLLDMDTKEVSSLSNDWKEIFGNLLFNLFISHDHNLQNCSLKDYIEKLSQVDPDNKMLVVMRAYIKEEKQEEKAEVVDCVPPSEWEIKIDPKVSISAKSTENAVKKLTKEEAFKLSEKDFNQAFSDGRISHGVFKDYYTKYAKQQLPQEITRCITQCIAKPKEKLQSWVLGNKYVIKSSEVHYLDGNNWATITEKVLNKLDCTERSAFKNAITKGFVTTDFGSNGIKIIGNVAELKIDANARLYTKIKYVNPYKASLIIFDHYGNHEILSKAINKNVKMSEEIVPCINPDNVNSVTDNDYIFLDKKLVGGDYADIPSDWDY